jgi:membrane-associated phospholipid phosphatase
MIKYSHCAFKKITLWIILVALGIQPIFGQDNVYHLGIKKEGITLGVGIGATIIGHILLSNADPATEFEIANLSKENLNFLDRSSAHNNSNSAKTISDVILFTSVALPFTTFMTSESHGNKLTIGFMAIETFLITNGITNILKAQTGRYRPFNYNPEVPLSTKLGSSSRLSFISGHASNTAAFSFFTAKVITDLHPDMVHKYLVWIPAAIIPATIGYLRVKAGKHFPTDVIGGYVLGAGVGYLIPAIHKKENLDLEISYNAIGLRYVF